MGTLSTLRLLLVAWVAAEALLALRRRARRSGAESRDRGSALLLWSAIALGLGSGYVFQLLSLAPLPAPETVTRLALAALVTGIVLRILAVRALGRFFTVDVAIHPEQRLVRTGLYRRVRHPSYTGVLLAFLACGLSTADLLGLMAVVVPSGAALLWRMRVEEETLAQAFGDEYEDYRESTWRLVPWVY